MMQSQSSNPIKTFTIGYSENYIVKQNMQKKLQNILELIIQKYVSSKDAMDVIPKLPNVYDEPFSGFITNSSF